MNTIDQNLEQRMYCLTLYNLSPIQQGIQSAHAIVEYGLAFNNTIEYQTWARRDKTIIILNGGSSISLKDHFDYLLNYELLERIAFFKEPHLFNGITSICFLADERIWNREKYPDHAEQPKPDSNGFVPSIYITFDEKKFIEDIGGEKNYQLKLFLEKFRLA